MLAKMGVGMGISPEAQAEPTKPPKDETDHLRLVVTIENKMVDGKKIRTMRVDNDSDMTPGRKMSQEFTDKESMKAYIDKLIGK